MVGGGVQKSYGGHSETPQTLSFRIFSLLISSPAGQLSYLGGVKVSVLYFDGNMLYFSMPKHIHFLSRVRNGLRMMVSGLNHLLGRVKRSDLVQSGWDTSPNVVGGLTRTKK